jgi:uncharacterized membrane protein
MSNLIDNIKDVCTVYFTNFPYYIYHLGNNTSNIAVAGIGSGFQRCQTLFWCSNIGLSMVFYYRNAEDSNTKHMNLIIFGTSIATQIFVLQQTLYLIQLLKRKYT